MKASIKASFYAIKAHKEVNHKYDGQPYEVHLKMCSDIGGMFIKLIPESEIERVFAAIWLHDTIEDCRKTYNDIKKEFGSIVADIVYACTNEKGKTRKERVKFFTSQMNWETENDEPVEWIFLVHHIVVQFIKWYNKYYGIELKSQVATGMPASTSLEGCPFHYCDNNPKCEGTCRYNSTLTTSQSKTNNNEK